MDKSKDPDGDMYVMKVNPAGAIIWKYFYGYPKEDGGNFIMNTKDNGFLISGHTNDAPDDECDGYILKIDKDGKEQWHLFVGTILDDVCHGAVEAPDGSLYFTGRYEEKYEDHKFDFLLCKVSANGDLQWLRSIPGDESEEALRMTIGTDNSLIIAGYAFNKSTDDENLLVVKTDLEGNIIWRKYWNSPIHDRANFVIPMKNGGCMIGGGSGHDRFARECEMLRLFTLDVDGNVINEFKPTDERFANSFVFDGIKLADEKYVVSGICSKSEKPFVAVFDEKLNKLKDVEFGNVIHSRPVSLTLMNPDEVMICGKEIMEKPDANIWIARTNISLLANVDSKDIEDNDLVYFPNPWSDELYISTSYTGEKSISIYTFNGVEVFNKNFTENEVFIHSTEVPKVGSYFFVLRNRDGKQIRTGNFIKK